MLASLDPSANIKSIQNAGLGAGASGSFFFFTSDKKYIMKTMSILEIKQMQRVLPSYYEHLDNNKDSYIAKTYGVFTITMDKFSPISVMIMENSLPNIEHTTLHYCFDMKGSKINREVLKDKTLSDLMRDGPTGGQVLKDLDFLRLKELKKYINFTDSDWSEIIKQITKDVEFL